MTDFNQDQIQIQIRKEDKAYFKWELRELDRVYGSGYVSYILNCIEEANKSESWWDEENHDEQY